MSDKLVTALNELHEIDPDAIGQLCQMRVRANRALAAFPGIKAGNDGFGKVITPAGILAAFGVDVEFDNGRVVRFSKMQTAPPAPKASKPTPPAAKPAPPASEAKPAAGAKAAPVPAATASEDDEADTFRG